MASCWRSPRRDPLLHTHAAPAAHIRHDDEWRTAMGSNSRYVKAQPVGGREEAEARSSGLLLPPST
jgi:hypothetical protein